jgi:O-antigen/teichoic acid export membrane protein
MTSLTTRLLRSSFFRVLNPIATVVVSFFMMPFVIRSIGDRWYGLWVLAATFIGYYGFFDFGLSTANERFISRALGTDDYEEIDKVFNTSLILFFFAGLLTLIVSAAIAVISGRFVDNPADINVFRAVILLFGLDIAVSFPTRAFNGFLYAHVRYDVVNIIDISKLLGRTALFVIVLIRGHGIVSLTIIAVICNMFQYLFTVVFVILKYPRLQIDFGNFTRSKIRPLFNYSIFSFIISIANQLRFHVDAFVITAFLGLAMVTHYNVGARIAAYYLILINNAIALVMPVFSKFEGQQNYDQIREKFLFVSKINTVVSIFLGGSILIYGRAFILRWMGEPYLDSYTVLLILTIGMIANTVQITSHTLLFGLSKHKGYAIMVVLEGAVNLILSLILVRKYGIAGVAAATTIPMLINSIFVLPLYAIRVIKIKPTQYIRSMSGGILLGAGVQFASWLLVRSYVAPSYSNIVLLGLCTSTVFIAVNLFILFNKEERKHFRIPI